MIASMIRSVSSSMFLYLSSTAGPTRTRIVGGFVTFSTFGSRALRGHTFSVPHSPTGITGTPRHVREAGRAPAALQHRVEERRPARDRALRHDRHELAGVERGDRCLQRLVRAGAAVDADAAERLRELTDDGRVEHLLLAEEAHGPARLARTSIAIAVSRSSCGGCATMIAGPRSGCARRRRCRSGRTGTSSGRANAMRHLLRLDAEELRDAGGTSRWSVGQRRADATSTEHRGSGLTANGMARPPTAAACRRRCRSRRSSREVDAVLVGPLAHGRELAVGPHERRRRSCRRRCRRPPRRSGWRPRRRSRADRPAASRGRTAWSWRARAAAALRCSSMTARARGCTRSSSTTAADFAGFVHQRLTPTLRDVRGLAGQRHARERLADAVEHPVEQPFARDHAARHHPRLAERLADDRPAGAREQRAVEVEDRCGLAHWCAP